MQVAMQQEVYAQIKDGRLRPRKCWLCKSGEEIAAILPERAAIKRSYPAIMRAALNVLANARDRRFSPYLVG